MSQLVIAGLLKSLKQRTAFKQEMIFAYLTSILLPIFIRERKTVEVFVFIYLSISNKRTVCNRELHSSQKQDLLTLLTYKTWVCLGPELCKLITNSSLKLPSNGSPSHQHSHGLNSFSPFNDPQASLSLRNESLSLAPPSFCLDKHLGAMVSAGFSVSGLTFRLHNTVRASWKAFALCLPRRQDSASRVFTVTIEHISTSCLYSLLLEDFQAGSVLTSARLIQNTTSGGLTRLWNTFLHSAQLGSVGGLPVNLVLHFIIQLIAEGHWFPFSSSFKLFYYLSDDFWLLEPCILMPTAFWIPYLQKLCLLG